MRPDQTELNLNTTMLEEFGDSAYFRLPNVPGLPRSFRGRVMSAEKLANTVGYLLNMMEVRADNFRYMTANERKAAEKRFARNEGFRYVSFCYKMDREMALISARVKARLHAIAFAVAL